MGDGMTDRPLIFSAPMVRALIEGRKTQTRRVLGPLALNLPCAPGDRYWVRETLHCPNGAGWWYRADDAGVYASISQQSAMLVWVHHKVGSVCSPIHMPRWASRLTLTVTDVRVQRVQEISEADAKVEGVEQPKVGTARNTVYLSHRSGFRDLWDIINAKRGFGWDVNPWVAALTFTVERRNIDEGNTNG
jgi:hypothetical protein